MRVKIQLTDNIHLTSLNYDLWLMWGGHVCFGFQALPYNLAVIANLHVFHMCLLVMCTTCSVSVLDRERAAQCLKFESFSVSFSL